MITLQALADAAGRITWDVSVGPTITRTPELRSPEAADRWTWLLLTAYTRLRLARDLTIDLRRPWEKPFRPNGSAHHASAGGLATCGHN
ncbi:hypothetical protein AB0M48_32555 [Lentzea sp. NPDC051208]|uniref:hypothetical protein n=1 Tax=Lentzea sp. NPDC051208 TaxID=3154642 RepID=UPI003416D162